MVNNTVNGKKIGNAAGVEDKIKFNYFACGKKSEKEKIDSKTNKAKPSIALIDSLRENGEIINENSEYVAIKAYPGGNPNKNKEKQSEDLTH